MIIFYIMMQIYRNYSLEYKQGIYKYSKHVIKHIILNQKIG